MLRAICLLPILTASLTVQGQSSWGNLAPPVASENLGRLARALSRQSVSLVVFDTAQGAWQEAFERLSSEGRLAELPIHWRQAELGSGPALARREAWKPGPHWALMDDHGKVLAHGGTIPTASVLQEALEGTGRATRLQGLRSFVAHHPEHLEARTLFLQELREVAQRRTLRVLGLRPPPPPDPHTRKATFGDSSGFSHTTTPGEEDHYAQLQAKPLPEDQDEAIWGEYARELAKYFAEDGWPALELADSYRAAQPEGPRVGSPLARFSPRCQEAYARILPELEAFLVRFPHHGQAWQAWADLAQAVGRDPKTLLASLAPPPADAASWPPMILRRVLLARARKDQDWRVVADLATEFWERVLDLSQGERRFKASGKASKGFQPTPWLSAELWDTVAGPLLEAHLFQNRTGSAEALVSTWVEHGGWEGALPQAAALARKAKLEDLARKWEALGK